MNSPDCSPLVNAVTRTLLLASSIKRVSLLKRVTYDLRLTSSHCLMFSRLAEDLLYLYLPIKWVTKYPFNSLKVDIVLGVNLLNHTRTSPFSVVGNALHIISYGTPCRSKRILNDSRWSKGYFNLSYASTCGILNLAERGRIWPVQWKGNWYNGLIYPS